MQRRDLLLSATAALFGNVKAPAQSQAPAGSRPAALGTGDGELVYVGTDPVRIKISAPPQQGRFAMIVQEVSPGTRIPVHRHGREDEIIFIHSGEGEAVLGDDTVKLSPGSILYVPQGTWHGGVNTGNVVLHWIAIYSPSGFEGYFREIGRRSLDAPHVQRTAGERLALDTQYAISYR